MLLTSMLPHPPVGQISLSAHATLAFSWGRQEQQLKNMDVHIQKVVPHTFCERHDSISVFRFSS